MAMIALEDALAAYARSVRPLPVIELPVLDACGLVLAEAAHAATDLPRFDQSALDGYCFSTSDLATASDATPVRLPIVQTIAASSGLVGARNAVVKSSTVKAIAMC